MSTVIFVVVRLIHHYRSNGEGTAQRDRGQKLLAEVSEVFVRGGHDLAELPTVEVYKAVRGLGVEIAMALSR